MDFNFFENDISYQTFNMNLNKIVWRLFKNIPKIFYEYFPKSNHTSSHKIGGCGSCCHVYTQNHLGQNGLIKGHTPYLEDHKKKEVVNEPKQR
jgi:hypothetical protein